ncbi:MAG: hypothetical protein LKF36_08420 [Lactobacillus sp.]|nr:hypothetical protein [Lactobacillus sp.]
MNIALIGPHGVGKTILGKAAAKLTNLNYFSIDEARSQYFIKYGYDPRQAEQYIRQNDTVALFRYWKPYAIATMKEILPAKDSTLFDLGSGILIDPTDDEVSDIQDLARDTNTRMILMLPSTDLETNKQVLLKQGIYTEITEKFLTHYLSHHITKYIFYTEGHTKAENIDRLVTMIHDIQAV